MSKLDTDRQAVPARAQAWDHHAVVDRLVAAIKGRSDTVLQAAGMLVWIRDDQIAITPARLVPQDGPRQTAQGRRKRFRATLANELATIGWDFVEKRGRKLVFRRRKKRALRRRQAALHRMCGRAGDG